MKRIGVTIAIIGMAFLGFTGIYAQGNPDEISKKFLEKLKDKGGDKSFDYLYGDDKALEANKTMLENNRTSFAEIVSGLGRYYGEEFISKDETGKSYARYNYLLKYENSPLKLSIVYYKPDDKWKVMEVTFTKQIDDKMPMIRQMPLRGIR